jgi:hypothetical protein
LTEVEDSILTTLAKRFEKPKVEADPVMWAKHKLNIDLWSKQREILRLLEIAPKVAVPSCHDAGKSFIAALATARFLAKYPPGTARVVSTAPSVTQVRAILWNEINSLHGNAKDDTGQPILPGRVNQTEWWIGGYMAGIGRKPSDYAPETFSGLHAEHILIIVDEAGGVPNEIWTGVDTLATNKGAVILAIGNPDDPQAEFKNICEGAPQNGWHVVRIPAWETPNLSGEVVPPKLQNVLLTKEWVDDKRQKWGEDDPRWASKVAAEFPLESGMTVVRLADVNAGLRGFDPDIPRPRIFHSAMIQLGVDIAASETGDETTCRERVGDRIGRRWSVQSSEPEDISDLIVQAVKESGATLVHVDATGVGFGFLSEIRKRCPGVAVMPFIAAGQAHDTKQFENRRAEAHWVFREKLRRRELDLSEMEHADETTTQLLSVRYRIKKGRIIVEPKDEIRKRIGRSPDDADALLLAVLPPEGSGMPAAATVRAPGRTRAVEAEAARAAELTPAVLVTPTTPRAVPERIIHPKDSRFVRLSRPRTLRAIR